MDRDTGRGETDEDSGSWPPLPLDEWRETKETLHRYCQMLGKVRMDLAPFRNHWWHVTLRVDTTGLTTGTMPVADGRLAEVRLDLVDHACEVRDSEGQLIRFSLQSELPCAVFHDQLFAALESLQIPAQIDPEPYRLGGPAFSEDDRQRRYDAAAAHRYWRILASNAMVLERFAGWFNGKQSPVHLFWHSLDLAHARFSGVRAPEREGADPVEQEAYSHEVIAFGFWPGDDKVPFPAFYSYTAPAPAGLTDRPLAPAAATWDADAGTALLPYDVVRRAADPSAMLLGFFQAAYLAGAEAAGWDVTAFATRVAPPPG